MSIRVRLRQIVEQIQHAALVEGIVVGEYTAMSRGREASSRKHNAIVGISAPCDRSPCGRIHANCLRGIIVARIENSHIAPDTVVRNDNRLTKVVIDVQLWSDLP